jgi:hypothetical protein
MPVEGTYLSWIKVDQTILQRGKFTDSNALALFLDREHGLRLSPGTWFQTGGESYLSPHFSPIDFFLGLRQFGGLLEMLEASNRVY